MQFADVHGEDERDGGSRAMEQPEVSRPVVPPVPTEKPWKVGSNLQEPINVNNDLPQPPPPNRHERRRLAALQRREGSPGPAKPLGMKVLSSGPHDPPPEPADPMFMMLQNIIRWSVEGINEEGTFLAFRAQFKDGDAVVILDPMDELHAEEVVRAAVANRAEKGFIGMIVPCLRQGKIQLDARRNSIRAKDMDRAVTISTTAVIKKFNQYKEQEARDAANRTRPEPLHVSGDPPPVLDGSATAGAPGAEPGAKPTSSSGTDPTAGAGPAEPADAPGAGNTPEAEPTR